MNRDVEKLINIIPIEVDDNSVIVNGQAINKVKTLAMVCPVCGTPLFVFPANVSYEQIVTLCFNHPESFGGDKLHYCFNCGQKISIRYYGDMVGEAQTE